MDRLLIGAFALPLVPLQFAYLLFLDMEGNLLSVFPDAQVVEAIDDAQGALVGGASVATGLVIAARWRAASGPRRRALLPGVAAQPGNANLAAETARSTSAASLSGTRA